MSSAAPSYERVNYLLRLRKQIERKLIIECLQRLVPCERMSGYRYFGFGSIYYADYVMFHKHLHIGRMTSVDNKIDDKTRFDFNKPYGFIDFYLCEAGKYIRDSLDWREPLLMWLDYDAAIELNMLSDIEVVAVRAKPNDILIITIDARPPTQDTIDEFAGRFGTFIPRAWPLAEMRRRFSLALREILCGCIKAGLTKRTEKVTFLPFLSMSYADTTPMYTLAGVFCTQEDEARVKDLLDRLSFVRHGSEVVDIKCPLLTPKEKACLDRCICSDRFDDVGNTTGLKPSEVEQYRLYYKYYPLYFESIV